MTTIPIPTDPTTSYTATYDAWNRLVKLEDNTNTITEYQYDGLRRRVLHKGYNTGVLNHTKHLYYNNNWQLLEERRDSNTSPTKQQIWGNRYIDDLVLRDHDTNEGGTLNERLYALQDANWNVTSYINSSGTVQERYIYNAYGDVTFLDNNFNVISNSTIEPDHLYAGYNYDGDVEMYHVRNRVYHPMLGTWLQRDPIGAINMYNYSSLSSVNRIDPFGLKDCYCDEAKSCDDLSGNFRYTLNKIVMDSFVDTYASLRKFRDPKTGKTYRKSLFFIKSMTARQIGDVIDDYYDTTGMIPISASDFREGIYSSLAENVPGLRFLAMDIHRR